MVEEKSYRLDAGSRRTAYLMLVGAVLVWGFALWTLKNTLKIGFRPQNLLPSLQLLARRLVGAEGTQPLTAEEWIPALMMLVLLVVVPLLIWTILEELRAVITVGPDGLVFRSIGIDLRYPWAEIAALRPTEEDAEEPLDELILRQSRLDRIRNPLVRFLHWQAYGRRKLPLYGGLEAREELVFIIQAQLEQTAATDEEGTSPMGAAPPDPAGSEQTAALD